MDKHDHGQIEENGLIDTWENWGNFGCGTQTVGTLGVGHKLWKLWAWGTNCGNFGCGKQTLETLGASTKGVKLRYSEIERCKELLMRFISGERGEVKVH
jgi:hypothetical protein